MVNEKQDDFYEGKGDVDESEEVDHLQSIFQSNSNIWLAQDVLSMLEKQRARLLGHKLSFEEIKKGTRISNYLRMALEEFKE